MTFDPYREWLQIPLDRRPPNYYDLLSLPTFESDEERIRAAGHKRIADVRRYQVGQHSEAAIRVMGELAAAFSCLTDASRKRDYDSQLRGADTVTATTTALAPPAPAAPSAAPAFDPYAQWLNIPPERRPPSYYDLIGVVEGEPDLDTIRRAGLERIALVRRYQVGPRSNFAIDLLAEMSRAFTCLTDLDRKREYDGQHGIIAVAPSAPPDVTAPESESAAGAGVIKWKPAPPPEPEPPPALKFLIAVASLPGKLDRGLAFFAGGPDNRLMHNFFRITLALFAVGSIWAIASLGPEPEEVAASSGAIPADPLTTEIPPFAKGASPANPAAGSSSPVLEWPDWVVAEGTPSVFAPRETPADPKACFFDQTAGHGATFDTGLARITWTPPTGTAGQTFEFLLLRREGGATPVAARFRAIVVTPTIENSAQMKLAFIPAGSFTQGSSETNPLADANETPQRRVDIPRPFYLGIHEVTQAQWQDIMNQNPSQFTGDNQRPVERVSWDAAVEFCSRLSQREGLTPNFVGQSNAGQEKAWESGYRLPTEAEWEYACRAGATTAWSFGDNPGSLDDYAWGPDNSSSGPHPVGLKQANAWGLHDMHGNVWEWCWDWYASNAYATGDITDPRGPPSGTNRVVRGGGWNFGPPKLFRCSYRSSSPPDRSLQYVGLRIARDYPLP